MPLPMYVQLLTPPVHACYSHEGVAEPHSRYLMLTERHIQAMWLEQKYFKALKTGDGQAITVLSPGIWNSGPGPDFCKAHLRIGDKTMRGAIELHLADDSWYHHKHHLDSNYNQVVLHISYWKPRQARPLLTADGRQLPCAYFDQALTIPEARILNLIDLDLYPYTHFSGTGACAGSLFRTLPGQKIAAFFRSAAAWRLEHKYATLTARAEQLGTAAVLGIAMALGYKHNTETFAQLFSMAKSPPYATEKERFALILGQCGFFDSKYQLKWHPSPYYQELQALYTAHHVPPHQAKVTLKQHQIRPPSHPVRRLAALAKIISDPQLDALLPDLLQLWQAHWAALDNKKALNSFKQQLWGLLPDYLDEYWEHHYAFETTPQTTSIALIGNDLKREMAVNVLLPLLYGHLQQKQHVAEQEAFMRFFASVPSSNTHKSDYLVHRFFGNAAAAPPTLNKIDMQQGAYQLHRDFCIHFEASCQGCPFVDRYKKVFI